MRILVLGDTGVVGFHMKRELAKWHEVAGASRTGPSEVKLDATDWGALFGAISSFEPQAVINAVKPPISIDEMETRQEEARRINALLPKELAELSLRLGFLLVHISTDWVYEGKQGEVYREDSERNPLNFYARTKCEAEDYIASKAKNFLILRTEGVFGIDSKGSNILARLKSCAAKGGKFHAAEDQYSQPISGSELARIAARLISAGKTGTYNATGKEYVSRLGFASMASHALGWNCDIEAYSVKDRKIAVPSHLRVDISKIESAAGRIMPLDKQILEFRERQTVADFSLEKTVFPKKIENGAGNKDFE